MEAAWGRRDSLQVDELAAIVFHGSGLGFRVSY